MRFSRTAAVRTPADIAVMRRAGRVVAEMHERIRAAIGPGVTTGALDRIGRDVLRERGANYVSFSGWEKIDQAEVGKGEPHGRPRVKFVRIDEMLETAATQAEAAATGSRD